MNVKYALKISFMMIGMLIMFGCATETNRPLAIASTTASQMSYSGIRQKVTLGEFINSTTYMRGLFSDGQDRLGGQARSILEAHLNQSNRFTVLNRTNLESLEREAKLSGKEQKIIGANYVITGSVSEFGRKAVGDVQLFGLMGKGKNQVAYAKVILNVVDTKTSEVIYSGIGAGEFKLSTREVIGFGSQASYDPTLTGKVLDLAIREAVDSLANGLNQNLWGDE